MKIIVHFLTGKKQEIDLPNPEETKLGCICNVLLKQFKLENAVFISGNKLFGHYYDLSKYCKDYPQLSKPVLDIYVRVIFSPQEFATSIQIPLDEYNRQIDNNIDKPKTLLYA